MCGCTHTGVRCAPCGCVEGAQQCIADRHTRFVRALGAGALSAQGNHDKAYCRKITDNGHITTISQHVRLPTRSTAEVAAAATLASGEPCSVCSAPTSCDRSPGGREGPWSATSTAFTTMSSCCCSCTVLGPWSAAEACRALVRSAVPPLNSRPWAASAGHAATCSRRQQGGQQAEQRSARTHTQRTAESMCI